jgi:hypothetical protein
MSRAFHTRFLFPAFVALLAASPTLAQAAMPAGLQVTIEPIIGYERVQKLAPTPHARNHLIYGARARAGLPLISGEAEYTRGQDREDFPGQALSSVQDTDERLKVGLVSAPPLNQYVSFQLRAGAEARRTTHEQTLSGTTSTATDPVQYNPYAGAGLGVHLGSKLDFSVAVTVIFDDFPSLDQSDYQTTAGFSIRFP